VTRTTEPARALLCPLARPSVLVRHRGAGFVAAEARPSRPVIFAAAEALEAKPLIRQLHGPVGIALAGRDRVSHPGDQHIAHQDLAHQPQRGAVRQNDVDACKGRPTADQAGLHFLVAGAADLAGVTVAVVEAPDAAFIGRQGSGKRDPHPMIARRQIVLALPVAIAEFQQPARAIEAQPFDDIARPTAAVTFLCQAPLGREHATMAHGVHVTLEVGLAAEQPEPVLDFPLDARRPAVLVWRGQRRRRNTKTRRERRGQNGTNVCHGSTAGTTSRRMKVEMGLGGSGGRALHRRYGARYYATICVRRVYEAPTDNAITTRRHWLLARRRSPARPLGCRSAARAGARVVAYLFAIDGPRMHLIARQWRTNLPVPPRSALTGCAPQPPFSIRSRASPPVGRGSVGAAECSDDPVIGARSIAAVSEPY
jgi:hypothetical protein